VTDYEVIALKYIKFWFWIDLSSNLPIEYLINLNEFSDSSGNTGISNNLIKTTKLNRT